MVLAAASMQEGLTASTTAWSAEGHLPPVLSFASSAAVARQASQGAPADIVVTSDDRWMNWLAERGGIAGMPVPLVANGLVVVAGRNGSAAGSLAAFAKDPSAGRLAIGEPESVPAGEFARIALQNMGLWNVLSPRLAPGENVRASLALVERGEAAMGIVYASDAAASDKVRIVQRIAPSMHPPIVYYAALTANSQDEDAADLLDFLTSAEGRAYLLERGFVKP